MQLYKNTIKEVEQSASGPQIGAFFDFDGTIIYGYSATKYLREQIRRGDVKPRQLIDLVGVMSKFSMGSIGFSAMMSEASVYLKGIAEADYIEFAEELYKKHIAKLIYPESRALIEAHLKKGHTVAMVSAATPYQVMPAAKELGITNVMCTRLEIDDGVFTGKVIKPTCYGMGKVDAADQLAEKYSLDMDQSFFYSDSDEDLELLEYVGKPRPLNPNSRLRRIASGRGWPVQDFNSRGKASIKDYLRTFAVQGSMVTSFMSSLPIYALTGSMQKARNFSLSVFADMACAATGIELDITGEEHLWSSRPCVFVFNHQSQADLLIMASLLRRDIAGVGKKEIAKVPILGKLMEIGGTVLIDRKNSASAIEAMAPLVDIMQKEGRSVCLAPEGTRSTSTNLGPFKKGAFHIAMQAKVPIVPIVIHNAIDVCPRGEFVMRPATVKVTVLPPVNTADWELKDLEQNVHIVRDQFLVELDQMDLQEPAQPVRRAKSIQAPKVSARRANDTIVSGVKVVAKKGTAKTTAKVKTTAKGTAKGIQKKVSAAQQAVAMNKPIAPKAKGIASKKKKSVRSN